MFVSSLNIWRLNFLFILINICSQLFVAAQTLQGCAVISKEALSDSGEEFVLHSITLWGFLKVPWGSGCVQALMLPSLTQNKDAVGAYELCTQWRSADSETRFDTLTRFGLVFSSVLLSRASSTETFAQPCRWFHPMTTIKTRAMRFVCGSWKIPITLRLSALMTAAASFQPLLLFPSEAFRTRSSYESCERLF